MIFGLFKKKSGNIAIVKRQYEALTAAARQPFLYTDLDVPDTVMGRFEMLSAVLILYFRRTRGSARAGQEIAQEIVDAFFEDVDHSIRELGVGDVSVPKKMKKLAGMFYGRLESYAAALEGRDAGALAAALRRNFHADVEDAPSMRGLASYLLAVESVLSDTAEEDVETGRLRIPTAGT
ncbi:ubiquinol-cytochrome C chaperone [Sinorhizobium medicae]|uniref:Ubiquinol-cytochrome C chaperone n=1 Tax=Sinorhizobium medicae TaxID=110321 RepID=A0A6G1WR77_9HYPH|nr:ubiquinol-cytochrome C chaperone family protein [Sinorhizobium medicae]MDX0628680.1 ubiquinol-cytochrome C chaperone [Sinorhizobium medicae]MDX0881146.1 ubiquinol-cytochrome C chaperone [Sinorhizobium medicae]MQW00672.1 ubiquinol-cytochrome C chaperone [Sinorhizobium medicae]MQW72221.1 ubiquinol-cytochrome C chaperone [Sinorhizobium medicae]MQX47147.1 ubiquinol-cytochrome C chaperone [Sinorhizobium medicae]